MKTSCRGHSSLPTSLSLRGTDVHFQGQRPSEPGNWLHCSCSFVQMPSFGTVGGGEGETGVCWLSATLLPLLSSTSYWCPKGPGLEVSPSEVTGSNFIWWIWRSSALRGPSGQTYWNPNKWACGGWLVGVLAELLQISQDTKKCLLCQFSTSAGATATIHSFVVKWLFWTWSYNYLQMCRNRNLPTRPGTCRRIFS